MRTCHLKFRNDGTKLQWWEPARWIPREGPGSTGGAAGAGRRRGVLPNLLLLDTGDDSVGVCVQTFTDPYIRDVRTALRVYLNKLQ